MMKTLSNCQIIIDGKPCEGTIQEDAVITAEKSDWTDFRSQSFEMSFTCEQGKALSRCLQSWENDEQIIKYERVKAFLSTHRIIPYGFIKNIRYD